MKFWNKLSRKSAFIVPVAFTFLTACNFLGSSDISPSFLDGNSTSAATPKTPFTKNWDFTTASDYSYSSNKIQFSSGAASLISANQSDSTNDATLGFGAASLNGVAWDGTNHYMRLASGGGCDGSLTDCNLEDELNSTWSPQWASIISVWHLDDALGSSTAVDSTGAHPGLPTNTTFGNAGHISSDSSYSGNGYINTGTWNFTTTQLTISAWINPSFESANATHPIFSKYDSASGNNRSISLAIDQTGLGDVTFTITADGTNKAIVTTAGGVIPLNSWSHIVATYNAGTYAIYVNGVSQALTASGSTVTGIPFSSGVQQRIGSIVSTGGNPAYFVGNIDEIGVWSKALTAAEALTIYKRQASLHTGVITSRVMDGLSSTNWTTLSPVTTLPFQKSLPDTANATVPVPASETQTNYSAQTSNLMTGIVGLWHLDEAVGTSGTASILDRSGFGNNGTPGSTVTLGASGRLSGAAYFNGATTSYLNIPDSPSLTITGDVTTSAWVFPTAAATGVIVSLGSDSSGSGWGMQLQCLGGICEASTVIANAQQSSATFSVPIARWTHIIGVRSTTSLKAYVNGALISTVTIPSGPLRHANMTLIGAFNNSGTYGQVFIGNIDEVAMWNRALTDGSGGTPNEILELYRRGANRLKYQVRSCPDATCATAPAWLGPDGTNQTFFTELNNNLVPSDAGDLSSSDSVNANAFTATFSNYTGLTVSSNRYFQYKTILESDDVGAGCNYTVTAVSCSPELQSVSVGPNHYDASNPTIVNSIGVNFATLASLTETLGTGACSQGTLYNLSPDGSTWYYLNGNTWALADGTVAKATGASLITANALATFPAGRSLLYFKVFLRSSGTSACAIDHLAIGGTQ